MTLPPNVLCLEPSLAVEDDAEANDVAEPKHLQICGVLSWVVSEILVLLLFVCSGRLFLGSLPIMSVMELSIEAVNPG